MKKKNTKKGKVGKNKNRFLTLPEIKVMSAFGQDWERLLSGIYDNIISQSEAGCTFISIDCENQKQRDALRIYFEWKQFSIHIGQNGKNLTIFF